MKQPHDGIGGEGHSTRRVAQERDISRRRDPEGLGDAGASRIGWMPPAKTDEPPTHRESSTFASKRMSRGIV